MHWRQPTSSFCLYLYICPSWNHDKAPFYLRLIYKGWKASLVQAGKQEVSRAKAYLLVYCKSGNKTALTKVDKVEEPEVRSRLSTLRVLACSHETWTNLQEMRAQLFGATHREKPSKSRFVCTYKLYSCPCHGHTTGLSSHLRDSLCSYQ